MGGLTAILGGWPRFCVRSHWVCCWDPGWSLASLTPREGGPTLPPAPPAPISCIQIGCVSSLSLPTTCSGPQNNLEVRFASSRTICKSLLSASPPHSAFLGSLCLCFPVSLFQSPSLWVCLSPAHISVILCLFLLVFVFICLCVYISSLPSSVSEAVSLSISVSPSFSP